MSDHRPLLRDSAARRNFGLGVALGALALACRPVEPADDLPAIVASSKYIDYSTTADASVLCMTDRLAREDQFIVDIAAYLDVDPPSGRVRYIWVAGSDFGIPATWPCEDSMHCYWYREEQDTGIILSAGFTNYHELVHAVDIPALGSAHRTLVEGLAEYLGTANTTDSVLPDFPAQFKAMLGKSAQPSDYRLAMHFVGSLLAHHGVEKYKRLRVEIPEDGRLEEFASAFASVYGMTLDSALAEMSGTPVTGTWVPEGCLDGVEQVSWTSAGIVETTLRGQCGDSHFVGAGFVDARPGFGKVFAIDVPAEGGYQLTITSPGGSAAGVQVQGCPELKSQGSISASNGPGTLGILYPGRHEVAVGFPQAPEPRGEVQFKLELIAPLPPP